MEEDAETAFFCLVEVSAEGLGFETDPVQLDKGLVEDPATCFRVETDAVQQSNGFSLNFPLLVHFTTVLSSLWQILHNQLDLALTLRQYNLSSSQKTLEQYVSLLFPLAL